MPSPPSPDRVAATSGTTGATNGTGGIGAVLAGRRTARIRLTHTTKGVPVAHDAAPTVTRNDEKNRYEIQVDGAVAGYTLITIDDAGRTVMPHTKVDPAFKGQGLGKILVADALADLAKRGAEVVPTCPFVAGYLADHDVPGLSVASPDAE